MTATRYYQSCNSQLYLCATSAVLHQAPDANQT